jgi:hypothetical protein
MNARYVKIHIVCSVGINFPLLITKSDLMRIKHTSIYLLSNIQPQRYAKTEGDFMCILSVDILTKFPIIKINVSCPSA